MYSKNLRQSAKRDDEIAVPIGALKRFFTLACYIDAKDDYKNIVKPVKDNALL